MLESKDFFFVYDFKMKEHLFRSGHRYITHARSIKNGREFWLYVKSPELQKSIDKFNSKKNHAQNGIV